MMCGGGSTGRRRVWPTRGPALLPIPGRLSGSGRRGCRGARACFSLTPVGDFISSLACSAACVSSRSSMASSSCSIKWRARSDDWPCCSRRALANNELVAFDLQPADGQLALRQAQHLALADDHLVRGRKVGRGTKNHCRSRRDGRRSLANRAPDLVLSKEVRLSAHRPYNWTHLES
jgi:hypothetical protein